MNDHVENVIIAFFCLVGVAVLVLGVTWGIVKVNESNNEKKIVKIEECGELENDAARALCIDDH